MEYYKATKKSDDVYEVYSENGTAKTYTVDLSRKSCTCPDHTYRHRECKHQGIARWAEGEISWLELIRAHRTINGPVEICYNGYGAQVGPEVIPEPTTKPKLTFTHIEPVDQYAEDMELFERVVL